MNSDNMGTHIEFLRAVPTRHTALNPKPKESHYSTLGSGCGVFAFRFGREGLGIFALVIEHRCVGNRGLP